MFVDAHCHLENEKFNDDRDSVVENAKKSGVLAIVNSGTDPDRNRETLALCEKYPLVRASFGWYPVGNFSNDLDAELKWIEEHKDVCVSIGEIGLDFDTDERKAGFEKQKEMFVKMIRLAKKLGKPIVTHTRKAELEAIEVLEEEGCKGYPVMMHCFCGRKSLIKRCVDNGWFLTVPPVVKRWQNFEVTARLVPLDQLLTETDAPYLSPIRGERNDSSNIPLAIKEIARIKGLDEVVVAKQIFNNAKRFFSL